MDRSISTFHSRDRLPTLWLFYFVDLLHRKFWDTAVQTHMEVREIGQKIHIHDYRRGQWSQLMIAYESKNQHIWRNEIFPNVLSKFGLRWTSVFCKSDIVFPELSCSFFWQECLSTLFEVHTNFICNPTQINDREWLYIKFRKTCNAIFEKKLHRRSDIVKVLQGWFVTTTLPNKYQANDLISLIAGP